MINQILKRAADKANLNRVRFLEKNIPTSMSDVTVFVFFGDMRSTAVLSSLLLRRFREEAKGSKYFILVSWPGQEGLFPFVDEYWEIKEEVCRSLYNQSQEFLNKSEIVLGLKRILNTFFEEVLDAEEFVPYYRRGLQQEFFTRFKHIKRCLPSVPSSVLLGTELNKKFSQHLRKVFIYPSMYFQSWQEGRHQTQLVSKNFWLALCNRLLAESITPVIYRNFYTHDLSMDLGERCLYFNDPAALSVLSCMRATGCVLDLFSGISRYAILARSPYLFCTERASYDYLKEYEVDDLCGADVPKVNLYLFPTISEENNQIHWNSSLFDAIIPKLISLLEDTNRDSWPSPSDVYEIVPYSRVREIKSKKLGTHFIKIPKY